MAEIQPWFIEESTAVVHEGAAQQMIEARATRPVVAREPRLTSNET